MHSGRTWITLQDVLCSVLCVCLVHRNIFSDCYSDTQNNPDILVGFVTLVVLFKMNLTNIK
jgi:DMSO/TMAO reductase YedYZ heme-binding membrane subunit